MRAVVGFVAVPVLVVVIGIVTQPVVLVSAVLALFGAVLLLGPSPTGAPTRRGDTGAAVPGGASAGAAGDGRPTSGGAR